MKILLLMLMLTLVGAANGVGQKQSVGERVMKGTWLIDGGGDKNTPRWYLEWKFDEQGKFTLNGYPPIHQEGRYRIVKTKGETLTLELFEQQGTLGTDKSQIQVVVNTKLDRLTIKDKGPFRRVIEKTGGY